MSLEVPSIIHDFFTNSQIPLTLSDPQLPDDPLILANESFYRMTGYTAAEALGSNCRFMQGNGTQKSSRNIIKGDFAASRDTKVLIRNYRKSGEPFDNYLFIFTVFDRADRPLFRIGSQFEVPIINRAHEFETHATSLLDGLNAVNESQDMARNQMIDTGELVGTSVKTLLMARLENLRAS